jgi:hypothetical protein
VAGTFIDHLERFNGTSVDHAAAIAAHVLRRWKEKQRAWFVGCMRMLELPRATVRRLKERGTGRWRSLRLSPQDQGPH